MALFDYGAGMLEETIEAGTREVCKIVMGARPVDALYRTLWTLSELQLACDLLGVAKVPQTRVYKFWHVRPDVGRNIRYLMRKT